MDDISFSEIVSVSAPPGWIIHRPRRGPWIGARRRGTRLPPAGWKLHVSATPGSAADVLGRALPIMLAEGVAFKVAAAPSIVAALNAGEGGNSQIGKFITVYPTGEVQSLRLAAALHEATEGLRGPRVVTDRALRLGSLVHYRYGAFLGRPEDAEPPPPDTDPFVASGVADAIDRRRLIGGRYVVVSTIHSSVGGSVLLAADIEAGTSCVLKQGGRDARVGPDGRDARDHLRHEASVLERLAPDPRIPAMRGLVEDGGDLYLVMEQLSGRTLASAVTGPCGTERTLTWGRQLASIFRAIHHAGLVYRDPSPMNVLVAGDSLQLVDFELACPSGLPGEAAGTPGYCSPQQMAGVPASVADDVYGMGALLYFLATGADPGTSDPAASGPGLERVIARCLDEDPEKRYPSMVEVDAALAELQVAS